MLVEMMSPAFKEKDEVRPPIRFKDGLNVVLGKEDGTNSIGKSSALLAIDFVFGGNTCKTIIPVDRLTSVIFGRISGII